MSLTDSDFTPVAMTAPTTTVSNVSNLDNLDVGVPDFALQQQAMADAWTKPASLEQEISGKSIEEQIDIINNYEQPEQPVGQPKEITDPATAQAEADAVVTVDLDAELTALENELNNNKIIEEENNPDNWEEATPEEWDQHRAYVTSLEESVSAKDSEIVTLQTQSIAKDNTIEIQQSTIDSLKWQIKDLSSSKEYLESSVEVMKGPEELKLIQLRRVAETDQSGHGGLSYVYQLAQEWNRMTGQDLQSLIVKLFDDNVQEWKKTYLSDFEQPTQQQVTKKQEEANRKIVDNYALD